MAAFSTVIKSRHGAKVGPGPWDPKLRSPPQSLKVGPGTSKVQKWDPRTPLRSLKVGLQDPLQSLKVGLPSRKPKHGTTEHGTPTERRNTGGTYNRILAEQSEEQRNNITKQHQEILPIQKDDTY